MTDDKEYINNLQLTILNLQDKLRSLTEQQSKLHSSKAYHELQVKVSNLEYENHLLQEQLKSKDNEIYFIKLDLQSKYEREINKLKQDILLINNRFHFAKKIEDYVKSLEKINHELTEKMNQLEKEYNCKIQIETQKYQISLDNYKKKTLDLLHDSKNSMQKLAFDNLTNSSKITMLQNNQLKIELADLSKLLEELLIDCDNKDRIIRNLKLERETHQQIEKIISAHNIKLLDVIGKSNNNFQESRRDPKSDELIPSQTWRTTRNLSNSSDKREFHSTVSLFQKIKLSKVPKLRKLEKGKIQNHNQNQLRSVLDNYANILDEPGKKTVSICQLK